MTALANHSPAPALKPGYAQIRRAVSQLLSEDSLKAKVFRGGFWLGGGNTAEQAARFGRNMILTRLLAPEAFGAMAIVLSIGSVVQSFTDIGVREGLVQNPNGAEDHYVDAAWWLGFGRALALAVTLFAAAPLMASFYENPQLTGLLRLSTLAIVFAGASSPRAHVAMKEMKFRKLAAIGNIGGICGVGLTIILSFVMRDVWALVIGNCAEGAARCALSFVLCPYAPSFSWNKEAVRDLLRFSRGLFGLSFLNLLFSRADVFVLAKLCSPTALGLYSMAINLVQTPTSFIMTMLGQTLLPALSQVQGDVSRTNRILNKVTSMIVMAGLPLMAFVVFCGHSLLALAYGPRYEAMTAALVLASAVALVNMLNGLITTIFYARGVPGLHRWAVAVMAATMVVVVYPLCRWLGPVGGQVAALLAVVAGYLLQVERMRKLTGLSLISYGKSFALSCLVSMVVVVAGLSARPFAALARPAANIALGLAACLLAYLLACAILLRGYAGSSQRAGVESLDV